MFSLYFPYCGKDLSLGFMRFIHPHSGACSECRGCKQVELCSKHQKASQCPQEGKKLMYVIHLGLLSILSLNSKPLCQKYKMLLSIIHLYSHRDTPSIVY